MGKPVMAPARKSFTFKLREGNIIGVKVTLRGKDVWFYWKLVNIFLVQETQGIKLTHW